LKLRDVYSQIKGRPIDRPAIHRVVKKGGIDSLADDIVEMLLSKDSVKLVPTLIDRLKASQEARRSLVAKRSVKVIRDLADEIRKIQDEIRRRREAGGGDLQLLDRYQKFLRLKVIIEEVLLLFQDEDVREQAAPEDWERMASELTKHSERADQIASTIRGEDVIEADWWDEIGDIPELGIRHGNRKVIDADIVDEE
jgi:hypothetical protein